MGDIDFKEETNEGLLDLVENAMEWTSRQAQKELERRGISSFTGKPFNKLTGN